MRDSGPSRSLDGGLELRPAHVRALLGVIEAVRLASFLSEKKGPDYLWPGFDFGATPIIIYRRNREAILVQHPDPPKEFRRLELPLPGLGATPVYFHAGALPFLPAVGAVEIAGRATAAIPLTVFGSRVIPEAFVASLFHETFHAFERRLGRRAADPSLLSRYPELSAVNNALGNVEGNILYDYLGPRLLQAGDAREAERAAVEFSVIRRERRAPLEDDVIEYETRLEAAEGLARYVEVRILAGAGDGYTPGPAFKILAGRGVYAMARDLIAERLARLPELNLHAAGAAWWRFFHTGMALALLADDLDSGWKSRVVAGGKLGDIVEERVIYDGGPADEATVERLKASYGYDERLEAERAFSRVEKRRKKELLLSVLGGDGARITFDVSALIAEETWWDSGRIFLDWDPATTETITQSVRIHREGLRFSGFGAELRIVGIPVVEDLKNRLFHVRVPSAGRLDMRGDGRSFGLERPAEFEEGLELLVPGVFARAASGWVQNLGETLYIKITR
jgi:hypothetical protein